VVLHNAPKNRQLEALQQVRIMIAFDRNFRPMPELQSELISREPLWIALNQRNPLAQKASIRYLKGINTYANNIGLQQAPTPRIFSTQR
jgi:hypothetical protein